MKLEKTINWNIEISTYVLLMSIFSIKFANIGAKKPFDTRENNTKILKIE